MPDTPTILIIDDEPFVRELIGRMLSSEGYRVLEAPDGPTGIQIAQTEPVDVIILDVSMPDMHGHDVTRSLKSDPTARPIPIIMLTAYDSDEDIVKGLDAGADDYITKSVSAAQLKARVRAMLRVRDLQNDLVRMEQERHDSQLAFARDIQKRLLPHTAPKLPEMELAVRYRPYEVLGGDFYDCFGEDGRLSIVLGDAEGHGPSAALLMATARAYIRASLHLENPSPAGLLEQVNRLICRDPGYPGFLPMMCLHLDCRAGLIRYCNAGHEGPVLFRRNSTERIPLSVTSPILGIQEGMRYSDREVVWREGDVLVCFTDGLTDGTGENDTPFGRKRLEELAVGHLEEPADRLAERIVASWAEHTRDQAKDDMTLILVRAVAARRQELR